MSTIELNLSILRVLNDLEDIGDQLLFGPSDFSIPELLKQEIDLENELEGLLLLNFDLFYQKYINYSFFINSPKPVDSVAIHHGNSF